MKWSSASVLLLATVTLVACQPDFPISPGAQVVCETSDDCPASMVCLQVLGRCIPAVSEDQAGPVLESVTVKPSFARVGTIVRVEMKFDEPLLVPPELRMANEGAERLAVAETAEGIWTGTHVVVRDAAEGLSELTVQAYDLSGNSSRSAAGTFVVDKTPPLISEIRWAPPASDVVSSGAVAHLSAHVDESVEIDSLTVLDSRNEPIASLTSLATLVPAAGGGFALEASVALEPLLLAHGDSISVQISVRDLAGNEGSARSSSLRIDDEPPVVVAFAVADGPIVGVRDVELEIEGVGASQMRISGDVVDASNTFEWVEYATTASVTLAVGDETKSVWLELRDAAFNESQPVEARAIFRDGPVLSAPTLSPPSAQSAVKNGDVMVVGGSVESGASVLSARVVRSSDGSTVRTLAEEEVQVAPDGAVSGEFVLDGAVHGDLIALELIVSARRTESVPANSRSTSVTVDLQPPSPVDPKYLLLVESGPLTTESYQDTAHTFTFTGKAQATVDAVAVRIYESAAASLPMVEVPARNDGGFAAVDLPYTLAGAYWFAAVDGAGNESARTRVTPPRADLIVVSPTAARAGLQADGKPVKIVFRTNSQLSTPPLVSVQGMPATYEDGNINVVGGDVFTYRYVPRGTEPPGLNASVVVIRLGPAASLLDARSETVDATLTTFDFSPPALLSSGVQHNPPGTEDVVFGTVSDSAGERAMNLVAFPVTVEALEAETTKVLATTTAGADGSFSLAFGDNAVDALRLRLRDSAGNVFVSPFDEKNDREPPAINSLVVAPAAVRSGEPMTVAVGVTDNLLDLSEGGTTVSVGGEASSRVSGTLNTSDGLEHVLVFEYTPISGQAAEGKNEVFVTVADMGGNAITQKSSVFFDFTPPTSRVTSPGDLTVWNGNPGLSGTAADSGSGVERVLVSVLDLQTGRYFDNTAFTATEERLLETAGTHLWSFSSLTANKLVEGNQYRVRSYAQDAAGNVQSEPEPVTFTFDATAVDAPVLASVHSIADGNVLVKWNAPENGVVDHYRVYYAVDSGVAPQPTYDGTQAAEGASPVEVPATSETSLLLTGLTPATYAVAVTAVYQGGAESPYSAEGTADANIWVWRNPKMPNVHLHDVAAIDESTFVVVGNQGLVMRTTNAGETWNFAHGGVTSSVSSVWNRGRVVVAASSQAILRSTDAGATWTNVGHGAYRIAGDCEPEPASCTLFAVDAGERVLRSDDAGASWTVASSQTVDGFPSISVRGDRIIIASNSPTVLVSTDGGNTWTKRSVAGDNWNIVVSEGHVDDNRFYATARINDQSTNYYSVDGITWIDVPGGAGNAYRYVRLDETPLLLNTTGVHALTPSLAWTRRVANSGLQHVCGNGSSYVAVGNDLYRSADSASWSKVGTSGGYNLSRCAAFGNTVVAAGRYGSLWRSVDEGRTWLPVQEVAGSWLAAVHRSGDNAVAAGSDGLLVSEDGGRSWRARTDNTRSYGAIASQARDWVAVGRSILRSGDNGATWSEARGVPSTSLTAVHADDGVFVAVGDNEQISRSDDGGKTWASVNGGGVRTLRSVWGEARTWLAVGDNTLLASIDAGRTWFNTGPAEGTATWKYQSVSGFGSTVVAANDAGGIAYSLDGGVTWRTKTLAGTLRPAVVGWYTADGVDWVGVSRSSVVLFSADTEELSAVTTPVSSSPAIAGNDRFLLITSDTGVFYSRDGGRNWARGLPAIPVDSGPTSAIWLGADGKGLTVGGGLGVVVALDLP